ncbi:AEC family transporter [Psychromonas sp. KJ10-10]|uniref:AEC family transporter n=1 Tax=Psychromonas sp. KJ10-10 TaxID=3391823 RepID=UPI0039B48FD2
MTAIVFVLMIIVLGFLCGQILYRRLPEHSYQIQSIAIFIAMRITIPLSVLLAIWQLNIQSWHLAWLPIIGTSFLLLGFVIGWLVSKCYRLPSLQHAVVAPAGSFTNLGAIGALVVFVYLGESGFALIPLFKLFEEVVYFGFLFPYAQSYSQLTQLKKRRWWQDPILKTMFVVLLIGGLLNQTGIIRPVWFESLTSILVPIGTFSLMVSVGLVFRFKSVLQHWRVALTLALCKQIILPIIVFCLVMIIGQADLYNGLFLQVAVLLAAMPMAFIVIMPATIYKLDQNLANACWIISSLVFLVMLPFIPNILNWIS